jgi:hypothetical protein
VKFVWGRFLERHRSRFDARQTSPGTHALVLGVSAYTAEAKSFFGVADLDCAALSALRFARWLVNEHRSATGAPLASLRLLLSPSELERGKIAPADLEGVEPCSGANVWEAIYDWLADCDGNSDNAAVLYGAGHGIRYNADGPVLLLADAWTRERDLSNTFDFPTSHLSLDSLRLRMSLFFADCCQQIDERLETLKLPTPRFIPTDPLLGLRREAWGLYRAATGGGSAYGVRGGTTHFVEALIEGLEGRSATHRGDEPWVVTTDGLKTTLPGLVAERISDQDVRAASEAGRAGEAPFHQLAAPPSADLTLWLKPEDYAQTATGSIDREDEDFGRVAFDRQPFTRLLECGTYRVKLVAEPPLQFVKATKFIPVYPYDGGAFEFVVQS